MVWLGTKREYVHGAPILFLYTYTTYVGLCERDTNLERYSVWVLESFFGAGGQSKNITYAMCVKQSPGYIIYIEGAIHEKRVEVSSA